MKLYIYPVFVSQLTMILIKMADISNEVRPMDVAVMWLECLLEEYFQQVFEWCIYISDMDFFHFKNEVLPVVIVNTSMAWDMPCHIK